MKGGGQDNERDVRVGGSSVQWNAHGYPDRPRNGFGEGFHVADFEDGGRKGVGALISSGGGGDLQRVLAY